MTLSCVLADGSAFSTLLDSELDFFSNEGFFSPNATLTVTLVPTAGNTVLGDADQDGAVTFSDIAAFVAVLQSGIFLEQADVNQDGELNFADIPAFIEILQAI